MSNTFSRGGGRKFFQGVAWLPCALPSYEPGNQKTTICVVFSFFLSTFWQSSSFQIPSKWLIAMHCSYIADTSYEYCYADAPRWRILARHAWQEGSVCLGCAWWRYEGEWLHVLYTGFAQNRTSNSPPGKRRTPRTLLRREWGWFKQADF